MESSGVTIFETEIGPCGIAWRGQKIVGVEIGDADEKETRYRLRERFPGADDKEAPAFVTRAVEGVRALLAGADVDFSGTPLALDAQPDLNRQVYEIILELKTGETTTYGAIARRIGDVSLSQAVGYALGKNPFPIIVPCHRVLGSNGKVGGFSAAGGTATKLKLLNIERARTSSEPDLLAACHCRRGRRPTGSYHLRTQNRFALGSKVLQPLSVTTSAEKRNSRMGRTSCVVAS